MTSERSFLTFALCLVPCALLVAAHQGPPPPPQVPQTFRAGTNLVLVDAYPQQDGQIVEGLTPEDFDVFEDGKPQKVEAFEFVRIEPNLSDGARRDPNNLREMYTLAADPHNRVFVAYLDTLHTTVAGSYSIRRPIVDMMNRVIGPDDLFGVMTPNMRPTDLTLGRLTLSIDEQLSKYWSWGQSQRITRDPADPMEDTLSGCFHQKDTTTGFVDWLVADGAARRFFDDILVERRREDRTLTSLEDLVAYLPRIREARTVVMIISDGWLLLGPNQSLTGEPFRSPADLRAGQGVRGLSSGIPSAQRGGDFAACLSELNRLADLDDAKRFRDLVTQASRSNLSFYPVASGGLAVFDSSLSERIDSNPGNAAGTTLLGRDMQRVGDRVQALRTLAENTDGIAIVNTNDLAGGVKRIVNDVSAYYLLGYASTNSKLDGKYRRIEVKMKRPGLSVHARRGYLASTENARAAASVAAATASAGPSPVDDALGVLARLRPTAEVFTYGIVGSGDLGIVAEIAGGLIESGKWNQGADVQAVVTGPNGEAIGTATARIDPSTRGTVLHVPLPAGALGPWRVSVKVTSGSESLEDRTTIDAGVTGGLIGGATVFRAAPGPRAPLRPVADFQFRRTERAHLEWPILKTLDQRQARLLGKNGQPLAVGATVTEREVNGQPMLAVDVNLAPLGPGDYVIEVTAGAGTDTVRRLVAIRVVP